MAPFHELTSANPYFHYVTSAIHVCMLTQAAQFVVSTLICHNISRDYVKNSWW